jgi:hypothetical protein
VGVAVCELMGTSGSWRRSPMLAGTLRVSSAASFSVRPGVDLRRPSVRVVTFSRCVSKLYLKISTIITTAKKQEQKSSRAPWQAITPGKRSPILHQNPQKTPTVSKPQHIRLI